MKGSDGIFNEGDYLLFYAEGTHRWKYDRATGNYEFLRHCYSDTAWYFLTSEPGGTHAGGDREQLLHSRITVSSAATDVILRHEREEINLIRSGREWYQQVVPGIQNNVSPGLTDLIADGKDQVCSEGPGPVRHTGISFTLRQGSEELKTSECRTGKHDRSQRGLCRHL
ncbi:MAG: hypothetical protein MZV63_35460 [Marinilabiliales bacterium]|nr:hypothetical protein [Marinilabiliales bacterium]